MLLQKLCARREALHRGHDLESDGGVILGIARAREDWARVMLAGKAAREMTVVARAPKRNETCAPHRWRHDWGSVA